MRLNFETALVTGATGLLGNNLVRALLAQGVRVKALVRSHAKGLQQFQNLPGVELVQGDLGDVGSFAAALRGCDVVFHTAAFFRENYKGGSHWDELQRINVDGTRRLLEQAYAAGVRRFVQTPSIAVLNGESGSLIDETQSRPCTMQTTITAAKSSRMSRFCPFWTNIRPCTPASFCRAGCGGLPISARLPPGNC